MTWSEPRPLGSLTLPAFPTCLLPRWLAEWVRAQGEALQVPEDLPGLLALGVLATVCAKRFVVEIRPGWREPLNIFTLVALPSGSRKSGVFRAAVAPLLDPPAAPRAQVVPPRHHPPVVRRGPPRLRVVRGGEQEEEEFEARLLARPELAEPEPLRGPIYISDGTPEVIARLLAQGDGRLAVLSDEGEIAEIIGGRYRGPLEVFLKGHSGTPIVVHRVSRPALEVRNPALTIGLAVQRDVLRGLATKRVLKERGLLARFVCAVPASNLGHRRIRPDPVPKDVAEKYESKIRAFLAAPVRYMGDGEIAPSVIRLTEGAERTFARFETKLEPMLDPEAGALAGLVEWGAKLPGTLARIAGLLALASDSQVEEVGVPAIEEALRFADYLIPHAAEAFDAAGVNVAFERARRILKWLEMRGKDEVTQREVHQGLRSAFPKSEETEEPLRVLESHGYLRELPWISKGGRPSRRYAVHPMLTQKPQKPEVPPI